VAGSDVAHCVLRLRWGGFRAGLWTCTSIDRQVLWLLSLGGETRDMTAGSRISTGEHFVAGEMAVNDELAAAVGGRTLEIVEQRRRTAVVKRRGWLVRRLLVLADLTGLVLGFALAQIIFGSGGQGHLHEWNEVVLFLCTLPGWIVVTKLYGLYERDEERTDHTTVDDFVGVFHMVTICTWIFFAGATLLSLANPDLRKIVVFWLAALAFVVSGRAAVRTFARRRLAYLQNAVIVGAGEVGQLVARKLLRHPEYGINLVGLVDADPRPRRSELSDIPIFGAPERLPALVRLFDIERVIIAFSTDAPRQTLEVIRDLRKLDVQIDVVPRLFEVVGPRIELHSVEGVTLLGLPPVKLSRSSAMLKRSFDIVGAVLGLVLAAPFFLIASWRVKRESHGPVFFRQKRLGMGMKEFTALKFRTMRVDADDSPHRDFIRQTMTSDAETPPSGRFKLDRHDVVTPFGRWLRRTSLDELPQLINVLRGDMSLVGPRPCIPYETEGFAPHHFERFLVPAGITGYWQVTARAHSTFGEALDMDVAYARSWSLGLDLRLLCKTPLVVLRRCTR
jgi:exopolysaccharide biosynthesis polyprenyl glycosylphosphotransferase